jgi:hypothetical protein
MNGLARSLISLGALLMVAGLVLWWWPGGGIGTLGKLPGDISIRKPGFQFYFPLTSCLLLSAVISLGIWLVRNFKK